MSKRIETVLIGTSLTEASDPVVRAGLAVARAAGARVGLVHACAPRLVNVGAPHAPEPPDAARSREASLRRKMEAQLSGIPLGERAGTWIEPGPAHRTIVETAEAAGADLIVVGAAEEPILAKMLGSTADRVVRRAACPVLVVRRELSLPPARVLLPLDLSPLSAEGLQEELKVLGLLAGARAEAIEVEALCFAAGLEEEPGSYLARHAAGSAFQIAHRTVSGYVEDEIVQRIREWEPDLVLLGTHGRNGGERFLLGSVATWILHNGDANVLIVPPAAAGGHAGLIPVRSDKENAMSWEEARSRELAHWNAVRESIGIASPTELLTEINAADAFCEKAREEVDGPADLCARCLFYQQLGGCREVTGRMSEHVAAHDWEALRTLVDEFIRRLQALQVTAA